MDASTLKGLIAYLGTPAAVIWIVSNVLDHFQKFVDLSALAKKAVMVILSIVLSFGSALLLGSVTLQTLTPEQAYAIIYASVIAFWFADQQHQAFAKRRDLKAAQKNSVAIGG
jgi:cytochrome c biogenesis protein CcdA